MTLSLPGLELPIQREHEPDSWAKAGGRPWQGGEEEGTWGGQDWGGEVKGTWGGEEEGTWGGQGLGGEEKGTWGVEEEGTWGEEAWGGKIWMGEDWEDKNWAAESLKADRRGGLRRRLNREERGEVQAAPLADYRPSYSSPSHVYTTKPG